MTGDGSRNGCRMDVKRCSSNPCFAGVSCRDTASGFQCGPCPAGYTGDGVNCRDINEVCVSLNNKSDDEMAEYSCSGL